MRKKVGRKGEKSGQKKSGGRGVKDIELQEAELQEAECVAEEIPHKEGTGELSETSLKLKEKDAEIAKNNDLYMRARADLENYKVRAQKEKAEYIRHANDKVIGEFLDILDNIERALEHSGSSDELESLRGGVRLTRDNMISVLATLGLKPVKAVGEVFDPNIHEAISHEEDAKVQPGTVIKEFKKGFFLHDRLLRPATVSVAKARETEGAG